MRHCHIQKGNIEKVQVSDKLLKPLTEVKYLNADNVSRYRCIMRIFYENNEKLNYWLYQEDVYEEMILTGLSIRLNSASRIWLRLSNGKI